MKIRLLTSLPILLASAAIIIVSSRPSVQLPDLGLWNFDKLLHLVAYFVYGFLLLIFMIGNFNISKLKLLLVTLFVGLIFAASDEIHQSFVPGRTASIYDFIADAIGILISLLLFEKIKKMLDSIFKKLNIFSK